MERLDPMKAELIGLLRGEGSYYNSCSTYLQYYPERKKTYIKRNKRTIYIQFANHDTNLLKHFKNLVKIVYSYELSLNFDRIRICKRSIIEDLLKYSKYGYLNWDVPFEILKGSEDLKIGFLRGFFDGEGTVSNTIRMFSTNKEALKKVSLLLDQLNIKNTFNGPYCKENRKPYFMFI